MQLTSLFLSLLSPPPLSVVRVCVCFFVFLLRLPPVVCVAFLLSFPFLLYHLSRGCLLRQNLIELVHPGESGEVVWRSRTSLVGTVKKSVGAKAASWLRLGRYKNDNNKQKGGTSEGSVPPQAIAGLYLRETPDHRLAIMSRSNSDALVGGGGDDDGDGQGAKGGDQGLSGAEFGVVLEGESVVSEAEKGLDVGGMREEGGGVSGEEDPGTMNSALGEDAGIEMMELGGEIKTKLKSDLM